MCVHTYTGVSEDGAALKVAEHERTFQIEPRGTKESRVPNTKASQIRLVFGILLKENLPI